MDHLAFDSQASNDVAYAHPSDQQATGVLPASLHDKAKSHVRARIY